MFSLLHQPSIHLPPPTLMETWDRNLNMQPYEQTQSRNSVSAFHRTTQKSSRSAIQRRFGALHVCIAWRIYYHKQLKIKNQKPKSPHQQLLPEFPEHSEEPLHPSCRLPSSDSSDSNAGDRSDTENTAANLSSSRHFLPDLHPPSNHTALWNDLEGPVKLLWYEKLHEEKHEKSQTEWKDFPFLDKSWDPKLIRELDRRPRKRPLDCDSLGDLKRAKQEHQQSDSSLVTLHPPSFKIQVQQMSISSLGVSCHSGCRCVLSRSGTELHPYQTALWEPEWKNRIYFRQKVLNDNFFNTFQDFFTSSLCVPLIVRQQEMLPALLSPQQMMTTSSSSSSSSWPYIQNLHDKKHSAESPLT